VQRSLVFANTSFNIFVNTLYVKNLSLTISVMCFCYLLIYLMFVTSKHSQPLACTSWRSYVTVISEACRINVLLPLALALASVVNDSRKWCCKLWHHLWSSFWQIWRLHLCLYHLYHPVACIIKLLQSS
jgi:hypothetical protein